MKGRRSRNSRRCSTRPGGCGSSRRLQGSCSRWAGTCRSTGLLCAVTLALVIQGNRISRPRSMSRIYEFLGVYIPCVQSRVPALSTNKITSRSPLDFVCPTGEVGIRRRGASVTPPGIEVTVVPALRVGSGLPLRQLGRTTGGRGCNGTRSGQRRKDKRREADHHARYDTRQDVR